ncbi:TPA: hypothetical protein DDZ86_00215 [Candidatus Dependentiae bacterium]|nr:hypothetical protein [Candidatus Dependentiae bacterium]
MAKKTLSKLSHIIFLSVVIAGQTNAMRGPILKPAKSVSEIVDDMKGNKKWAFATLIREYEKENSYPEKTRLFINAVMRSDLKKAKKHLEHSKIDDFMGMLKALDFLKVSNKTIEPLIPLIENRIAEKDLTWLEEHSNLLCNFEPTHFKSLAHKKLVKFLESAKKDGTILKLNNELTPIFNKLPEGLKNHFIQKGCVIDCNASLYMEKILQLKKWLAKKDIAQKIIALLNVNHPFPENIADFDVYSKTDINALFNNEILGLKLETALTFYKKRFSTSAQITGISLLLVLVLRHCLIPSWPWSTDIIFAGIGTDLALLLCACLGLQPNPVHKILLDNAYALKNYIEPYK